MCSAHVAGSLCNIMPMTSGPGAGAGFTLRGRVEDVCSVINIACDGRGVFVQRLEHLTCFVAGNLALGVHTGAVNGTRAVKYMALAKNLTNTCYEMYRRMPTGARQPNLPHAATSCQTPLH